MTLNQNQLTEIVVQGQIDLNFNNEIISCQIDTTESGTLVPGQAVTIVDSASGIPKVIAATANSDDVFGFIVYTQKDPSFVAGDAVEVAFFRGAVMYMTASAAIARGAKVMIVVSGSKVVTRSGGGVCIGRALDKASGNGSLIRVLIDLPGAAA